MGSISPDLSRIVLVHACKHTQSVSVCVKKALGENCLVYKDYAQLEGRYSVSVA